MDLNTMIQMLFSIFDKNGLIKIIVQLLMVFYGIPIKFLKSQ